MLWLLLIPGIPLAAALALFLGVCFCERKKWSAGGCDCLLVLGALLHPDGRMSKTMQYRCDSAAEAYRRGGFEKIILCGGQNGEAPSSEAEAMRGYMLGLGVPDEAMLLEDTSKNTAENLRNASRIMARQGLKRAAIVTSDYHLRRVMWLAHDFRMDVGGVPAKSPQKGVHWLKSRLRECVSWVIFWKCHFIPVKGFMEG